MIFKVLTVLVLVAAILGGTGYFVYEFHFKPKKLDVEEKKVIAEAVPTPTPDPSEDAFKAISSSLTADTPEARDALLGFLRDYPDSVKAGEVKAAIGRINTALVLSPVPSADKVSYSVVSGDALVKIAAKFKSSAELIYRVNQLSTINLKIGQSLVIPQIETALVIDRTAGTVTVLNHGQFFKEYQSVSNKLPAAGSSPLETKVSDKFMMKGDGRLAFGSKDYESGERWIVLAVPGAVIRSAPAAGADGVVPPMPPGLVLSPEDTAEIFVLVQRATPVTIK